MQNDHSGLEVVPLDGPIPKLPEHYELEVQHKSLNEKAAILGQHEIIPLHYEK